jgi:protein-glutamine gamma-glutamyltransferase
MRAMDIPARVVTGYQGGELNAVDGYWVVRQRDAHAWAEVWLQRPGLGAGRSHRGGGSMAHRLAGPLRPPRARWPAGPHALDPTLMVQLRAVWEAVNNSWNQWVLNYTQGRQLDLLQRLGFHQPQLDRSALRALLAWWCW